MTFALRAEEYTELFTCFLDGRVEEFCNRFVINFVKLLCV